MDWRRWLIWSALLAIELILVRILPVPLFVLFRILELDEVIIAFITTALHHVAPFGFQMVLTVYYTTCFMVAGLAAMFLGFWAPGWLLVECYKICVLALNASLIVQAVCNQLWDHRNTPRVLSPINLRSRWTSVVNTSFDNVNGTGWFFPVVICDQNSGPGDPFSPLTSVLHLVEIRRHSRLWDELVLWKVSALNGNMKIVHNAHLFGLPFYDVRKVMCFESDGLIGVFFKGLRIQRYRIVDHWYFYDTRTNQWTTYTRRRFPGRARSEVYVAMWCIGRTLDRDGRTIGWRIRLLYGRDDKVGIFEPEWKICLVNSVIELGSSPRLISQEEIRLDAASQWLGCNALIVIRTSSGGFGIWSEHVDTAPVMLYNVWTNTYDVLPFRRLQLIDRRFSDAYGFSTPEVAGVENSEGSSDQSDHEESSDDESSLESVSVIVSTSPTSWPTPIRQYFCPVLLNGHECIRMMDNNGIYRTQFEPSSMKRIATRAIFDAAPNLRHRMNADQFRRITGVNAMDAHFADAGRGRWPSIVWGFERIKV